jgi:hypothetical protein
MKELVIYNINIKKLELILKCVYIMLYRLTNVWHSLIMIMLYFEEII